MQPLQIAVVGLGRMGKRHVHTLLYRVPRAKVVAVCSTDDNEVQWAKDNEEYQEFGIDVYSNYGTICRGRARGKPSVKVMAGFSRRFDASYRDASDKIYQKRAIGSPFMVRSDTCDLRDESGFFVRYAARNGGIFVDCAIHDIDLSLWYLGNPVPKSCWAAGTLQHHPDLKSPSDVDNAVGIVEFWGGKIAYFYCSRTHAHGHDVCTEITGTDGKLMVNVVPRQNNVVLADKLGMRHEVQPEYWQRFQDAFALEANEFVEAVLKDKEVPVKLETGIIVMKIGQGLQHALLTGEVVRFNEQGGD